MSNLNVNNITPLEGKSGTVSVSGSLLVSGSITANGNIVLGDQTTDSISFGAEVSSSIIPDADNTYDLGSSTKRWKNVYVNSAITASSILISGSNTFTNWGNFRNRFPQNNRAFEVSTNPYAAGGFREGMAVPTPAQTGSAPHLHFMLSGSGQAGIGLLNPEHTLHVSSSSPNYKTLFVRGTTYLDSRNLGGGNNTDTNLSLEVMGTSKHVTASITTVSSSLSPLGNHIWDLGVENEGWRRLYVKNIIATNKITCATASIGFLSSSAIPSTTNNYNLGSTSHQWKEGHITSASIGLIYPKQGHPLVVSGSTTFNNHVSASSIELDTDGGVTTHFLKQKSQNGVNLSGSLVSIGASMGIGDFDLGKAGTPWNNLYARTASFGVFIPVASSYQTVDNLGNGLDFIFSGSAVFKTQPDNYGSTYQRVHIAAGAVSASSTLEGLDGSFHNKVAIGTSAVPAPYNSQLTVKGNVSASGNIINTQVGQLGGNITTTQITASSHISASNNSVITAFGSVNDSYFAVPSESAYYLNYGVTGGDYIYKSGPHGNIGVNNEHAGTVNGHLALYAPNSSIRMAFSTADVSGPIDGASQSFATSASLSAIRFQNLPTSHTQASQIGTGSLWLSGSDAVGTSKYLMVFTG